MEEIMRNLVSINGVSGCLLADKEGELINAINIEKLDKDFVSALVADVVNEVKTQMGITKDFSISALAEKGMIFLTAKENFVLALLTDSDIDTGEVRLKLQKGAELVTKRL